MAFPQKEIGLYKATAVHGDRASQNVILYTGGNYITDGSVCVGDFVWRKTQADGTVTVTNIGADATSAGGATKPLGIVERIQTYVIANLNKGATMVLEEKTPVTVAVSGPFYLQTSTEARPDDEVYFPNAPSKDGLNQIACVHKGGSAPAGYTKMAGWVCTSVASAGEVVRVTNQEVA